MANKEERMLAIENWHLYRYYYERLVNIALSQFQWVGLPDTCDRLYFERMLLFRGKAAMYTPKGTDFWLTTDYVLRGKLSVYDYPTEIIGVGGGGNTNIEVDPDKWRILFDNMTREPLITKIDLYAKLLYETHQTIRSNLKHQNTPYIVACNRNKLATFRAFFKKVFSYDPVIETNQALDIQNSVVKIDLGVEFKGNELYQLLQSIWREALSMLGISYQSTKKERLLEGELQMNQQGDLVSLNSRLMNREEFCDKMNKAYGTGLSVTSSIRQADYELQIPGGDL